MSMNLAIAYVDRDTGIHLPIKVMQTPTQVTLSILGDHEPDPGASTNLEVLLRYEQWLHTNGYHYPTSVGVEELKRLVDKLVIYSI